MNNLIFTQEEVNEYKLQEVIPSREKVLEELKKVSDKLDIQMITSAINQQPGGPPCQCLVAELC